MVQLEAWGSNPLLPAPDIDVRVNLSVSIADDRFNYTAELAGDLFPNIEVLVQDHTRSRRMLQSYVTDGGADTGPFVRLWGARQAPLHGICDALGIDRTGRFL